jgi:hypothetical protein
VPGIVANSRRTKNQLQVWVINICLGWTFLGWVVALVMACSPAVEEGAGDKKRSVMSTEIP